MRARSLRRHVCEYSHCVRLVLGRGAFVHQLAALDFLGFSHPLINLVAEYVGGERTLTLAASFPLLLPRCAFVR